MEKRKSRTYIKTPDERKDNLSLRNPINAADLYASHCATCH